MQVSNTKLQSIKIKLSQEEMFAGLKEVHKDFIEFQVKELSKHYPFVSCSALQVGSVLDTLPLYPGYPVPPPPHDFEFLADWGMGVYQWVWSVNISIPDTMMFFLAAQQGTQPEETVFLYTRFVRILKKWATKHKPPTRSRRKPQ